MRYAFRSIAAMIILTSAFAGCVSPDPEAREASAWGVSWREIPKGDWATLPASRYAWVRDSEVEAAVSRLEKAPVVELQSAEAAALSRPEDGLDAVGGSLHAFLVRGIAFGRPTFAVAQVSAAGTLLRIHQSSIHGEIIGSYSGPLRKRPMVVLLDRKPERLFPTAMTGGDAAWRGWTDYKFFRSSP